MFNEGDKICKGQVHRGSFRTGTVLGVSDSDRDVFPAEAAGACPLPLAIVEKGTLHVAWDDGEHEFIPPRHYAAGFRLQGEPHPEGDAPKVRKIR